MKNVNKIKLDEENEEFAAIKQEWFDKAKSISTIDELGEFWNHLFNDYEHDYGTVVHATSAFTVAAAWLATKIEGLTGFQASFIKWEFMKHYEYRDNKCGLKLLNFDNMLYPQNEDKFSNVMSEDRFVKLKEEAEKLMKNTPRDLVNDDVWKHWERIAEGNVPFGWVVEEDK